MAITSPYEVALGAAAIERAVATAVENLEDRDVMPAHAENEIAIPVARSLLAAFMQVRAQMWYKHRAPDSG